MRAKLAFALIAALYVFTYAPQAHPQAGISLEIEKHARLSEPGAAVITIRIVCGPFEGVEEFQEAVAGAFQATTGAEAEGGIDGSVVCDGVERTHTARLSPFSDAGFKRGPAVADVSLFVCVLVADEQICFQGSTQRRVIVRGRLVP